MPASSAAATAAPSCTRSRPARELGYRTLRLDTTVKQLASRLLYRSEGFAEVERTLDHPGETTIVFEKPL